MTISLISYASLNEKERTRFGFRKGVRLRDAIRVIRTTVKEALNLTMMHI